MLHHRPPPLAAAATGTRDDPRCSGRSGLEQAKYRAFLSYSHRDGKWAGWLHRRLETYRPPRALVGTSTAAGVVPKRLAPVFRDREELASATDLGMVINQALADSACQIVVCSPQAAQSRWVNEEILAFKRLGREDRIFCLIVAGEPNATDMPGRESEECFPPGLRYRLGADGQLSDVRTEPIAADARAGKDGKNNAKLKLIAAVLGVGFDVLRRRDAQRRNRRVFFIACAATIGMVAATALAAFALVQRAAALRQEARAEREADAATQATNFLIGMFRIIDPGEARGNTVTAREVLDKGAARIDAELSRQPQIQARLMDTIGTVYTGLGLYREATPLLERAVARRRALSDATGLSESLIHYADLQNNQAQFAQAEKAYREAAALAASQPKDRRSRIALADTLYGLGALQDDQGNYAEAEHNLRQALVLQHQLYGEKHGDIARTTKTLARTLDDNGNLKAAIPLMRAAVSMQRELRGTQPHPDLAESINDLGKLLEENGDYDEAERLYREALALKRHLYGDKHPEIAQGLNNLAFTMQDKGELADAEATYREALAMQRELLGEVHPDVANTLNNLAFVQDDRGDAKGALATEREALHVYRQLFPNDHPSVAAVLNRIGFWLTLQGEYPEAGRYLSEGLSMRQRLFDDKHPDVASSLENLAILQVATHQYPEALESSRKAAAILTAAFSATHWRTAIAESAEGAAQTGLGDYADAEQLLTRSNAILRKDPNAPEAFRKLTEHYLQTLHEKEHQGRHPARAAQATRAAPAAAATQR
jgi:tetratricopeptide (TPR) repeat protein